MSDKELELAARLLDIASDEFSNHGCNDMDLELLKPFSDIEKVELCRQYREWNGDPENWERNPKEAERIGDSSWMAFMADKLRP